MKTNLLASKPRSRIPNIVGSSSAASAMARILLALGLLFVAALMFSLLLPSPFSFIGENQRDMIKLTKAEERELVKAIEAYRQAYGRFPVSSNVQHSTDSTQTDFTYGGIFRRDNGASLKISSQPAGLFLSNDEVVAILMDFTNYPDDGRPTANMVQQLNPKHTQYLIAKYSGDDKSWGVGMDLVYRDPWGNPFVITLNLKDDNQCQDAFYRQQAVSQQSNSVGYFGLINSVDTNGNGSHFTFKGKIMVWSAGPDGKLDLTKPAIEKPNKDNIVSWQ